MDGEDILTTIQYMTAKRELEDDLRKNPFPVYNVYGGGVIIDSTKPVSIQDAFKQGVLASAPGSVDRFMADLMACRGKGKDIRFEPRGPMWATSVRNAEKRLCKLFKDLSANQGDIHKTLQTFEAFLKQDPLYMPYLFNESIDMAGLTRAKRRFEAKDFPEFKRITKSALKKVRLIDRKVCGGSKEKTNGKAVA